MASRSPGPRFFRPPAVYKPWRLLFSFSYGKIADQQPITEGRHIVKNPKPGGPSFARMVVALVLPMALQNLINVAVTSADVLMLERVGTEVLSGASLAGTIHHDPDLFRSDLGSRGAHRAVLGEGRHPDHRKGHGHRPSLFPDRGRRLFSGGGSCPGTHHAAVHRGRGGRGAGGGLSAYRRPLLSP